MCGVNPPGLIKGLHFYDGTLNGRKYLDFFLNHLPPLLENIEIDIRENLFFEHDGTPAHNTISVRQYLNSTFGNRWRHVD